MREEYFNYDLVSGITAYSCPLLLRIKLALFGERIEEYTRTGVIYSWYAYKGKLYIWDVSVFNRGIFF